MRTTVLFRLLVFCSSLKLHVQSKNVICGANQYTVTNGSFSYCLNCATCHPGYGLYPVCGQSVTYPPSNIGCKRCPNETFSDELDSAPCYRCQQCAKLEIVAAPCTITSDRICNGTCKKGYFYAKKVPHTCQQCSYCCFDGKDEEQPECIKQGLNATGRHCSARLDKQCRPLPGSTATVTTQGTSVTHLLSTTHPPTLIKLTSPTSQSTSPSTTAITIQGTAAVAHLLSTTHSPALPKLSSSTPHPKNRQVGNHPAVIAPSILSGLLLAVLVIVAILCKRKKQIWRRKKTQGTCNNPAVLWRKTDAIDRTPTQGNIASSASQVPQHVKYCGDQRVQALQNTGYVTPSPSATPEVSPSVTPQQTDDEVDKLPDVNAERKKRFLKRQSSKEPRSNALKKDGINESLFDSNVHVRAGNEGSNYQGQDSEGVGQSKSRRNSFNETIKRKLSISREKDCYQRLGQEDPDEPREGSRGHDVLSETSGQTADYEEAVENIQRRHLGEGTSETKEKIAVDVVGAGVKQNVNQVNTRLSTSVVKLPLPVLKQVCMMLNIKRDLGFDDFRMLAEMVGLDKNTISNVEQAPNSNPTYAILKEWSIKNSEATVRKLIEVLKDDDFKRMDVVNVLEDWVYEK